MLLFFYSKINQNVYAICIVENFSIIIFMQKCSVIGDRKSGILKFQSSNSSDIKPVLRNVDFDSMLKKNQDTETKQVLKIL